MTREGKMWTASEFRQLETFLMKGMVPSAIAKRLGRSKQAIWHAIAAVKGHGEAPKAWTRRDAKTRSCLKCRTTFATTEDYRLCNGCRDQASNMSHMEGVSW